MPMRTELPVPPIGRHPAVVNRNLLAVSLFCALGLLLSFAFMRQTDAFEQSADLAIATAYLSGQPAVWKSGRLKVVFLLARFGA